jgi:hypothetical protein
MNLYLSLALSYLAESLTLIIGTGFSKWITNGKAPNWLELIQYCIDKIDSSLKDIFLMKDDKNEYIPSDIPLSIVAQLLEIEAEKKGMVLKEIVCDFIHAATTDSNIDKDKVEMFRSMFEDEKSINIITTNYDTIISDYIFPSKCRIFTEGAVFSKLSSGVDIFHIHGILKNPQSLVLTQKDYYDFQLRNNYFSRKLYTLIHENSIGILGYSLNDSDINFIINEANTQKMKYSHTGDIFYITKNEINSKLKPFYKSTFDIEVLEKTTFEDFIIKFESQKTNAGNMLNRFSNINAILSNKEILDDDYLKKRESFFHITKYINMNGLNLLNDNIYALLLTILEKKKTFCGEDSAWEQYDHLSDWLIELLSMIELNDTAQEKIKEIIMFSLNNCSQKKVLGCSWDAYKNWEQKWKNMLFQNQIFVKNLIKQEFTPQDSRGRYLLIERM